MPNRPRADARLRRSPGAPRAQDVARIERSGIVMARKADRVAALGQCLAERIGAERHATWFRQVQFLVRDDGVTVAVPSVFLHDWIRKHFWAELLESAAAVLGGTPVVELEVQAAAAKKTGPDPSQKTFGFAEGSAPAPASEDIDPQPVTAPAVVPFRSVPAAAEPELPVSRRPETRRRAWGTFETFQVGNGNRLASTAARMTVDSPGKINPVVLYGPPGTGKSHLLEAVWSRFKQTNPRLHAVHQSAEQFTTDFVAAVRTGLPSFRRKYRSVDAFLVDDIHFFRGKKATLVEFLHTVTTLQGDGKQVILTADRPPQELHDLGGDFIAKISGGLAVPLELPDLGTRIAIVRQSAAKLDLPLPDCVVDWVAERLAGSARELTGAVHRLQLFALAHEQAITRPLAERALADLIKIDAKPVRLSDIEQAVCAVCGLEPADMQSNSRSKSVSHPRMLAMWLARRFTRAPYSEIGKFFGRRSHSTVISAEKQVASWVTGGRTVEIGRKDLRADEIVRLVEQRLQLVG